MQLELPREKFELVKLALQANGTTLVAYLTQQVDGLYSRVSESLKQSLL